MRKEEKAPTFGAHMITNTDVLTRAQSRTYGLYVNDMRCTNVHTKANTHARTHARTHEESFAPSPGSVRWCYHWIASKAVEMLFTWGRQRVVDSTRSSCLSSRRGYFFCFSRFVEHRRVRVCACTCIVVDDRVSDLVCMSAFRVVPTHM